MFFLYDCHYKAVDIIYKVEIFTNNTLVTNFTLEPAATSLLLNNLTTGVIYTVSLAVFNRYRDYI